MLANLVFVYLAYTMYLLVTTRINFLHEICERSTLGSDANEYTSPGATFPFHWRTTQPGGDLSVVALCLLSCCTVNLYTHEKKTHKYFVIRTASLWRWIAESCQIWILAMASEKLRWKNGEDVNTTSSPNNAKHWVANDAGIATGVRLRV